MFWISEEIQSWCDRVRGRQHILFKTVGKGGNQAMGYEYHPTGELQPHPLNEAIYDGGVTEEFVTNIRNNGIRNPLVITEESQVVDEHEVPVIISGHRRWRAAKEIEQEEVPVTFKSYESELEERMALLDFNNHRDKTFSEKMQEAEELEAIIEPLMRERQERGRSIDDDLLQDFAEGGDTTRAIVADHVGLGSGETYRKAKKMWTCVEEGDAEAELVEEVEYLIMDINEGEATIHGAFEKYERLEQRYGGEGIQAEERTIPGSPGSEYQSRFDEHFDQWLGDKLEGFIERHHHNNDQIPRDEMLNFLHEQMEQRFDSNPDIESTYMFLYRLEKEGYGTPLSPVSEDESENDGMRTISERKPSREVLQTWFHQHDKPLSEIAARYGVIEEIVRKWIHEENIPLRVTDPDIERQEDEGLQLPAHDEESGDSENQGLTDPFEDNEEHSTEGEAEGVPE